MTITHVCLVLKINKFLSKMNNHTNHKEYLGSEDESDRHICVGEIHVLCCHTADDVTNRYCRQQFPGNHGRQMGGVRANMVGSHRLAFNMCFVSFY